MAANAGVTGPEEAIKEGRQPDPGTVVIPSGHGELIERRKRAAHIAQRADRARRHIVIDGKGCLHEDIPDQRGAGPSVRAGRTCTAGEPQRVTRYGKEAVVIEIGCSPPGLSPVFRSSTATACAPVPATGFH